MNVNGKAELCKAEDSINNAICELRYAHDEAGPVESIILLDLIKRAVDLRQDIIRLNGAINL